MYSYQLKTHSIRNCLFVCIHIDVTKTVSGKLQLYSKLCLQHNFIHLSLNKSFNLNEICLELKYNDIIRLLLLYFI